MPKPASLKCPECLEAGLTSRVYSNGSSSTLMGWSPFYDEAGEYHNHNPNRISNGWYCSNKHYWAESFKQRCPNPNCNYAEGDVHA